MNAYNLDRMGWIPMDKILRFGADGKFDKTVTLTALSRPENSGFLMARIPFNSQDKQQYYTVEYRVAENWDQGIGGSRILIHEVSKKDGKKCSTGATVPMSYQSYLLGRSLNEPVESIRLNGVRIDVISKDTSSMKATVRIRSKKKLGSDVYGPNVCKQGYVWRQADLRDYVCTTPKRRNAVKVENSLAASRRDPNGGPYGYDTCKQGFVWRDAWPGDHVCVVPSSRTTASKENDAAYSLLAVP
jgi:hypothetical protein